MELPVDLFGAFGGLTPWCCLTTHAVEGPTNRGVEQWLARWAHIPEIVDSSPTAASASKPAAVMGRPVAVAYHRRRSDVGGWRMRKPVRRPTFGSVQDE